MRLIAWNCNMAFHRKVEPLLALRPDIAVISECAEPGRLSRLSATDFIAGLDTRPSHQCDGALD